MSERQSRVGLASSLLSQNPVRPSQSTIEAISTGPNYERRTSKNTNNSNPRLPWNSSTVIQPTKTPRSVLYDSNRLVENNILYHKHISSPANLPLTNAVVTGPVKVVHPSKTKTEEPSRTTSTYIRQLQQTYPANTKLIRTAPEGKERTASSFYYFRNRLVC